MNHSSTTKSIILLIICTFFWGSSFPAGKYALTEIHPFTLVLWRFIIASGCLAVYLKWSGNKKRFNLSLSQWSWVIAASVLGVGGLNLGLFTGLTYTSATNGSLIMALSPLMTALIACLITRTLPTFSQCFSLIVSLSGVLLVITNGHLSALLAMKFNHGDKLIFCGMFSWSIYTYLSQGIGRWIQVIPYTFIGMLSGALVIGIMCILTPEVHPFSELAHGSFFSITSVIYIGLFATVAGYLLWLNGVRTLGSANASLFFNFVPIFSVLTSLMLGQTVTLLQMVGIAIVILGLLLPRMVFLKRSPHMAS